MVFFNSFPRIIEHYQPDSKATIDATELKPFFSKLNKEEELGDGEMPGASGTTKVLISQETGEAECFTIDIF